MKHIAEKAGVSLMTVSRALKNNPRQSQATRKRIQKLAKEMGYRPHPYVSALMSSVAMTRQASATVNLGVMHFNPREEHPHHKFYDGILARADELGYHAEPVAYDPLHTPSKRLREILLARGIRGLILMPATKGSTSIDFDFDGFSVVTMGHTIIEPVLPKVATDIFSSTFLGLDELIRRGYRSIGMINSKYVNALGQFIHSGAMAAYRDHVAGECHLTELILDDPKTTKACLQHIKTWILREKLDAIISPIFDFLVYDVLVEMGFEIPGKIGYLHLLYYPNPKVSQLDQNGEFMGAKAVDVVVAAINRNEFKPSANPYVISTMSDWLEGETTPKKLVLPSGVKIPMPISRPHG